MDIQIRPLQIDDARVSYKWRNDPEVWKYTGSKPDRVITQEIETEWIKRVMDDSTSKRFAILADGTYVGNIYLTDITDKDAQYHIFIGDKSYWGKGIAQIASKILLDYAEQHLPISKVYLKVKSENAAAVAVYRKLGFQADESATDNQICMSISIADWKDHEREAEQK